MRVQRHGDPNTVLREAPARIRKGEPCTAPEIPPCPKTIVRGEYCDSHWRRWREYGDPLGGQRTVRGKNLTCARLVRGKPCGKKFISMSGGINGIPLCVSHYNAGASRRRRALKLGNGPNEVIDLGVLYERDGGICYLCGEEVLPYRGEIGEDGWGDGWTADHVIPLVRGGTETWDNVRLAHRSCNCRKRDRMPEVTDFW